MKSMSFNNQIKKLIHMFNTFQYILLFYLLFLILVDQVQPIDVELLISSRTLICGYIFFYFTVFSFFLIWLYSLIPASDQQARHSNAEWRIIERTLCSIAIKNQYPCCQSDALLFAVFGKRGDLQDLGQIIMRGYDINIVLQSSQYLILSNTYLVLDFINQLLVNEIVFLAPEVDNLQVSKNNIFKSKFHIDKFESQNDACQNDHEPIIVYIASQVKKACSDLQRYGGNRIAYFHILGHINCKLGIPIGHAQLNRQIYSELRVLILGCVVKCNERE